MPDLSAVTTFVNLFALAASLWLGFYIITRSAHSDLSRLAALTLWSLAAFFLYNSLAINIPTSGAIAWLRQAIIVVLPLWLHVTVLLLPERARMAPRVLAGVALAYGVALLLFAVGVASTGLVSNPSGLPATFTSARAAGPLFIVFFLFLIVIYGVSILNLRSVQNQIADAATKKQFSALILATLLAGFGGLYLSTGIQLGLDWPTLPGDAALAAGVLLLGYAVARYSALLEGRRIERDFRYTLLAVGSLTTFYVLVTLVLYLGGHISFLTLILMAVGAISFNSLYDGLRVALDRLFYHGRFQQLRANLRALAREAGTGHSLSEQLQAILMALCRTLHIRKGLVTLKNGTDFVAVAALNGDAAIKTFPSATLTSNEIMSWLRPTTQGLEGMSLLIPLFAREVQIGAIVLGTKEDERPYSEQELDLLDDLAEQIAGVVGALQAQDENAKAIDALVADFRARERALELQVQRMVAERKAEQAAVLEGMDEDQWMRLVEEGLRHLYDYPYLGEHALGKLCIVAETLKRQRDASITSLERGKAVNELLLLALHKLRPAGTEPKGSAVPAREWHYFIILNDSYVLGQPNREIMARLYISEGTFNRARRRALRGVAQALLQMEQEARAAPAG
jgi:GAF domain-containing protein